MQIWTIGHSTRSLEDLVKLLQVHSIKTIVDVRSFPGSRRYPHFNKETFSGSLLALQIDYFHFPLLGGRRRPKADSLNTALQNPSFRAYADYMESDSFKKGIKELLELAAVTRTAVMCAESVWWRCHRSLIADYLKAHEVNVEHILTEKKAEPHRYTAAANIVNGELSYRGLLGAES